MEPLRYVVIMAGGNGTRLWPHSRHSRPKQVLPLLPPPAESLLAATVHRVSSLIPLAATFVVTTAEQVGEVRRLLPALPLDNILVEPIGRNTAPCIGLAAHTILRRARAEPGSRSAQSPVIAVLPSDHHIRDEAAFLNTIAQAFEVAEQGHVVTIGIRPTAPETGYGYIELAEQASGTEDKQPPMRTVTAFVEKPDRERARSYLAAGNYLWNSGMFFFPAQRILDELHKHQPQLAALLGEIGEHPERLPVLYPEAPSISIDYAVMEKLGAAAAGPASAMRVVPGSFGWSDVGSFTAVGALAPADAQGNHVLGGRTAGSTVLIRCRDNIVWSSSQQVITALGVEGLVIAVTEDAVLVLPQSRAQEVREIVSQLQSSGRGELL